MRQKDIAHLVEGVALVVLPVLLTFDWVGAGVSVGTASVILALGRFAQMYLKDA